MTVKTIEAGSGDFVVLRKNQTLRVIDPRGGQTGDLVAFRDGDVTEWLSNGRTFDYGGTIYLTKGHTLFSNNSNPMLAIAITACPSPGCNGGTPGPLLYEVLG